MNLDKRKSDSNRVTVKPVNAFYNLKFNFSFIKKYITMDLHMKATIDDLKPTFANLLNINLFAKKLIYYNGANVVETSKTMQELIDDKEIADKTTSVSNEPIILEVREEEEGA